MEPSNVLTTATPIRLPSITRSMQVVAQHHGVSVMRQVYEIWRLRRGPGKLTPFDYYRFQVWRKSLSWDEKRAFLSDAEEQRLNYSLTAPELRSSLALIDDKAVFLALAEASGIPVTPTQAFFAPHRRIGRWQQLSSEAELADFLLNTARYPLFGKPSDGRATLGAIQIERCDADGFLWFDDEHKGPHARALAAEIAQKFPSGYLLQDCLMMADNLRPLAPDALGPMRLTTIYDRPDTPSVLMAFMRLPAQGTEVGPNKAKQRLHADLNMESCTVNFAMHRDKGVNRPIDTHPVTGAHLPGFAVPQLAEAMEIALRAHRLAPQIGLIGWDIALSDQGVLIMEGNGNPTIGSLQHLTKTGFLASPSAPRYAAAKARADAQSAAIRARKQAWELGAIREVVAMERKSRR